MKNDIKHFWLKSIEDKVVTIDKEKELYYFIHDLVEKSIPQKIKDNKGDKFCPCCKNELLGGNQYANFCPWCSQALDYEEEV